MPALSHQGSGHRAGLRPGHQTLPSGGLVTGAASGALLLFAVLLVFGVTAAPSGILDSFHPVLPPLAASLTLGPLSLWALVWIITQLLAQNHRAFWVLAGVIIGFTVLVGLETIAYWEDATAAAAVAAAARVDEPELSPQPKMALLDGLVWAWSMLCSSHWHDLHSDHSASQAVLHTPENLREFGVYFDNNAKHTPGEHASAGAWCAESRTFSSNYGYKEHGHWIQMNLPRDLNVTAVHLQGRSSPRWGDQWPTRFHVLVSKRGGEPGSWVDVPVEGGGEGCHDGHTVVRRALVSRVEANAVRLVVDAGNPCQRWDVEYM